MNLDRRQGAERALLERMNRQIVHRGPDDDGFYVADNVGLAMRRLSIIDLKTGQQPISNEDGTLWLVYNGEIYNYRELREQLSARGHRLRTNSDTETIVHLYEDYGRDCVRHLRGMFAFALWDQRRRCLFAARDRLGIKPLYYHLSPHSFLFGSEIKAILAYPGVIRQLDTSMLPEYLAFGYLSGPGTLFSGIHKLPPGCSLELDESGNLSIQPYWDLAPPPSRDQRPEKYYVETYRQMLEDCVKSHLMSDVPLGVFLSGGLDSSTVAALTTKLRGEPIQTFSVGYEEAAYSELSYAREVAAHLGSVHHEVRLGLDDFFAALPRLIWHEDEPIAWPSSVALYFVARLAREHVTVVLTGEGSDETLGGYGRYPLTLWNTRLDGIYRHVTPAALRRRLRSALADSPWLGADMRRKLEHTFLGREGESWTSLYFDNFLAAFSEAEQADLLRSELRRDPGAAYRNCLAYWGNSHGDLLHRLLYTDIKTYLVELLMKQDQMSMAASVESRVPFLDHVLVEFTAEIPSQFNIRGLSGKWVLKSAVRDILPDSITHRRKMGFPTPWKAWLSGPRFAQIQGLLLEPRALERGWFREERVRRLLAEHQAGQRDHTDRLWRLLNLELWARVFLDADPQVFADEERTAASGLRIPAR